MTFVNRSTIAVFAVAVALLGGRTADAAVVFDSGGYELPRYGPGELAGQDTQGPWLKDAGSTGTAVVQTAVVQSGTQAVQFTRPAAATGDTRYGVQKALTPTPPLQVLRVNWSMNVQQTQAPNVDFGPFFGVEGYDVFNNVFKLIGSLGMDASTGDVLIQETGSGSFIETGAVLPFNTWNNFTLEMNYVNQTYRAIVNGAPVGDPEPFVDPGIVGFTDAPLATLAATEGAGFLAPGTAYFDNYSIEIVPEPSTLAVIGLASLGLLSRRRPAVA